MTQQTFMNTTSSQMHDDRTDAEPPIAPQPSRSSGGNHDTHIVGKNRALRAMLGKHTSAPHDSAMPKKEVTLLIRGVPERVVLSSEPVILGRMEMKARGFQPDIDLSPYGAQGRGVSRVHARLVLRDGSLYIADLYSTNGTFVGGQRLEANEPYRLHNGEEVLLGSLVVQVVFE